MLVGGALGVACAGLIALICFERQIRGFILMGKAVDAANTAVTLWAASLSEAHRPRT